MKPFDILVENFYKSLTEDIPQQDSTRLSDPPSKDVSDALEDLLKSMPNLSDELRQNIISTLAGNTSSANIPQSQPDETQEPQNQPPGASYVISPPTITS